MFISIDKKIHIDTKTAINISNDIKLAIKKYNR